MFVQLRVIPLALLLKLLSSVLKHTHTKPIDSKDAFQQQESVFIKILNKNRGYKAFRLVTGSVQPTISGHNEKLLK